MATNTSDVLILGAVGGVVAYMTNFMGFKTWADQYIPQVTAQPEPPVNEPPVNNPPVKNDPPPKTGTTFQCTSYPRCNTVSGTDARKTCCCKNKCALMGRTFKSIDFSKGGICYCNPAKTTPTPTPTPASCTGACPLGKRWAIVNGRCSCINCTNTCGSCYDRGTNCTCKLNTNKLTHSDTYCKSTCGGYSCWTNYPCPNRGARAQKCVKGTCTQARAAWIAAYSCKSSFARTYNTNRYPNEALDEGMMQVPTLA